MSRLFEPLTLGDLRLDNRIIIAPMCQYSSEDGDASDWHMIHVGNLALSGAGLMILEATAVSPEGRISPQDLGLYSDRNEETLGRVLKAARAYSPMPIAVQLAHAGRKASTEVPWNGGHQLRPEEPNGWQTVAPSPLPYAPGEQAPVELSIDDLVRIRDAFAASARRAARLGLDAVQVHGAHG